MTPSNHRAELRGQADAKAFDLGLRKIEAAEREHRRGRLAAVEKLPEPGDAARARIERLEREIATLSSYQHAVRASRVWRLASLFRRLLGRGSW
jgi:hypothetical protein